MSEDKKNPIAEILAKKKAQQQSHKGNFNPTEAVKGKINNKSFGHSAITRKAGRGS